MKASKAFRSGFFGKKSLVLSCAVVLSAALLLTGCGDSASEKKAAADASSAPKVLRVGTNATYVPFEFIEESNGNKSYSGFDMDLAREVGKRLGMEVEIKNIPFDGLIPAMLSGELDMIASGMVITPEREEKLAFIPYYDSGLGILVAQNIDDVKTADDLKGKRVAVQMGTTGSVAAHKIDGIASIREFDHNSEALLELKQGGADAVLTSLPVAKYYLKTTSDSNAKLVPQPITKQTMGLGFAKDDKELYEKVQKIVADIKADGTYAALEKKWID